MKTCVIFFVRVDCVGGLAPLTLVAGDHKCFWSVLNSPAVSGYADVTSVTDILFLVVSIAVIVTKP